MPSYRAHGLDIDSELELPLAPACGDGADLGVRIGSVPEPPGDAHAAGALCRVTYDRAWVDVPGVAHYGIDRDTIVVEPVDGADPRCVETFVLNSAIGYALTLRDALVLQAATVTNGDHAVVILAPAGRGRSALAAALTHRGCGLLSDDMCVVAWDDDTPSVHCGAPALRVWPDVLDMLGHRPDDHRPVRPGIEKRWLAVDTPVRSPRPIGGVLALATHNRPEVVCEPIQGSAKFTAWHRATFRHRVLWPLGFRRAHFDRLASTVGPLPAALITRPTHGLYLDAVASEAEQMIDRWLS